MHVCQSVEIFVLIHGSFALLIRVALSSPLQLFDFFLQFLVLLVEFVVLIIGLLDGSLQIFLDLSIGNDGLSLLGLLND